MSKNGNPDISATHSSCGPLCHPKADRNQARTGLTTHIIVKIIAEVPVVTKGEAKVLKMAFGPNNPITIPPTSDSVSASRTSCVYSLV